MFGIISLPVCLSVLSLLLRQLVLTRAAKAPSCVEFGRLIGLIALIPGLDGSMCNADQCRSMCAQIVSVDTN